ncbi:MAG TPA: FecR domain-containing protein [Candidatus Bipolaricaulota bacterium]|nr:FecR domain-containing protein [Candidatus Bipolaricaulota bacterium]
MPKVYSSYSSKENNYYKKPFYKLKIFYIALVVVAFVGGFVIWSIAKEPAAVQTNIISNDEESATEYQAVINYLRGEAEYQTAADQPWQNLSFTQKVEKGTSIRTKSNSKLELTFSDGSLVRLDENSALTVQEFNAADIIINHIAGNAYHRVNPDSTAIYQVFINGDEVTALGTAFNTYNENKDLTKITVIESKVKVKVYKDSLLVNMKNVESGKLCVIDKTKSEENMVETKDADKKALLENDWFSWNKDEDSAKELSLGFFEDDIKLKVTEPSDAETTTDEDSYLIKGEVDKDATLKISGVAVSHEDEQFEHEVSLSEGKNEIELTAELDGEETKQTITITYDKEAKDEIGEFKLSTSVNDDSVKLTWTIADKDTDKGFKIVKSSKENPAFPADENKYITQSDARTYTWTDIGEGTYHFRVCVYQSDGKCENYTNDASAAIVKEETKTGSISLTGSADGTTAKLSWTTSDLDASKGFKVAKGSNANPTYPGNDAQYLSDKNTRSYSWTNLSAGTYHFRVCEYTGSGCGAYSNDVTVTIAEQKPTTTGSISLTAVADGNGAGLTWATSGLDAAKGFKVVKGSTANPTYPGNDAQLVSGSSFTWMNLPAGTYHFRVCEYTGSGCGAYSNDATVTITGDEVQESGSISLSGSSSNGKANLSWSTSGNLNFDNGYKVVFADTANPVYPGNQYHYISDKTVKSDIWSDLEIGKTYHFRVCQYLGGSCGVYSNDVMVTIQ